MNFINVKTTATKSELIEFMSDNRKVNANVKFDDRRGTPFMRIKERNGNLKITCEMINRSTKDNGFLEGTYFKGKITEKNGETLIKGVILTAPIYHLIWFSLLCVLIWQCFYNIAMSSLPILFVSFELIMFYQEFKKQGYIKRYIMRAIARVRKK